MNNSPTLLSSSLKRSIISTFSLYFLIQIVLIIGFALLSERPYFWSLAFSGALHISLMTLSILRINDFCIQDKQPHKINFANRVTFFRISSVPTFLHILLITVSQRQFALFLLVFAAIISVTDLFDGIIARKLHQETAIGRYLDSASDYGLLFVITGAFLNKELVPLWFILLILLRYSFQSLATFVMLIRHQRPGSGSTLIGKIAVFFLVFYYNLVFLSLLPAINFAGWILQLLPWVCSTTLCISLIERLILFIKDIRTAVSSKTSHLSSQKL